MMKKLLGLAFIVAVMAGGLTANAQTPTTPIKDRTEKYEKHNKAERKDKKDRKEFKGNKEFSPKQQGKHQRPDLFEGITLTPEQQSQLDALKAEHKAPRGGEKGSKEKMSKEDRQARHAEFSAKVKEILTPEQWVIYEQNVEKMKANRPQHKRR